MSPLALTALLADEDARVRHATLADLLRETEGKMSWRPLDRGELSALEAYLMTL